MATAGKIFSHQHTDRLSGALRVKREGLDWLRPDIVFMAIMLFGVIMPIVPFYNYEDSFSVFWPFYFFEKNDVILRAVSIYIGVAIFFQIGYRFAIVKSKSPGKVYFDERFFITKSIFLSIIGFLSFVIILYFAGGVSGLLEGSSDRTRAFAGLQGLFLVMNVLVSVSIAWLVRLTKKRRGLFEVTLYIIYTAFIIALIALQGQKSTIFIIAVTSAVILNVRVKKIGIVPISIFSVLLFLALMAYHIFKQEYLVLGRIVSISGGEQFWSSLSDFLNQQIFGNFMQLQSMSVLIEGMPDPLEFQYGQTYLAGLLLLVPRFIFPDKPLPSTGVFTEAFWPDAWRSLGTTLPPGVFGEAYMNFGTLGALVLGLLGGFMMGRLRKGLTVNPSCDMALINYAVAVASMLHFFRGELASVAYLALSIALPCRFLMKSAAASARA